MGIKRWCNFYLESLTLLAAIILAVVIGCLSTSHWKQSGAYVDFDLPQHNLKAIVLHSSNENTIQNDWIFSIYNSAFPYGFVWGIMPKENVTQGYWMRQQYFLDSQGKLYKIGNQYDQFLEVNKNQLEKIFIQESDLKVIYQDPIIFESIKKRWPVLEQIPSMALSQKKNIEISKSIFSQWSLRSFFCLLMRLLLFMTSFVLIMNSIKYFYPQLSMGLQILTSGASYFLISFFCAELNLFYPNKILLIILLCGWIIKSMVGVCVVLDRKWIKSMAWYLFFGLAYAVLVSILSLTVLYFLDYGVELINWKGDTWKYISQAKILSYFHGWPRAYLKEMDLGATQIANYPYGMGLLFSWIFWLSGISKDMLLFPSWNLSAAFFMYKCFILGANFVLLYEIFKILKSYSFFYSILSLGVFFITTPIFIGYSHGADTLYWYYLLGCFLLLFFMQNGDVKTICIVGIMNAVLCLFKEEAVLAGCFLLWPMIVRFFFSSKRTHRYVGIFLVLGLVPFVGFKLRNYGYDIQGDAYLSLSLDHIVYGIKNIMLILVRQLQILFQPALIWKYGAQKIDFLRFFAGFFSLGYIILMIFMVNIWIYRHKFKTVFVGDILWYVVAFSIYFFVWTVIYMLSNYPSLLLQIDQSFDRLIVALMIFTIFYFPVVAYMRQSSMPGREMYYGT